MFSIVMLVRANVICTAITTSSTTNNNDGNSAFFSARYYLNMGRCKGCRSFFVMPYKFPPVDGSVWKLKL